MKSKIDKTKFTICKLDNYSNYQVVIYIQIKAT